jgi:hypothetical protein
VQTWSELVLAMTLHQNGRPADARAQLEQALAPGGGKYRTLKEHGGLWDHWMITQMLRREAEGLIGKR